jgi:hypothetical protein
MVDGVEGHNGGTANPITAAVERALRHHRDLIARGALCGFRNRSQPSPLSPDQAGVPLKEWEE